MDATLGTLLLRRWKQLTLPFISLETSPRNGLAELSYAYRKSIKKASKGLFA